MRFSIGSCALKAVALAALLCPFNIVAAGDGSCVPGWSTEIGQPGVFADFDAPGVFASIVYPTSEGDVLIVGGVFNTINDVNLDFIAQWDGVQWSPLGSGLNNRVRAMTIFEGDLVVVGDFTQTADGSRTLNRVARWDGVAWQPFGNGFNGIVRDAVVYDSGNGEELYVGGQFTASGAATIQRIAKWTGTSWQSVGGNALTTSSNVLALEVFQGELYAGGQFDFDSGSSTLPGVRHIAKWNGQAWSPVGQGVNARVEALHAHDDGTGESLYVGGVFIRACNTGGSCAAGSPSSIVVNNIAKWNGTQWSSIGNGVNQGVFGMASFNPGDTVGNSLFVYGDFTAASNGQISSPRIIRWTGSNWVPVQAGVNNSIETLTPYFESGSKREILYVGGRFTMVDGRPARRIARWGCLPVDRVWNAPSGGSFLDPMNWTESDVPGPQRRAVFDDFLSPNPIDPIISVTLPSDWFTRALAVNTDTVRLNLNSSTLVLTESAAGLDPSISVGAYNASVIPGAVSSLEISNDSVLPASLIGSRVEVGHEPNSDGTLRLTGPDLSLQASGTLLLGEQGLGTVLVESSSQLAYSGNVTVGGARDGLLTIRSGSTMNSLSDQTSVVLARDTGSSASVLVTNPQSSWVHISGPAGSFVIGDRGSANIEVTNGGFLRTTSLSRIRLADQVGSSATVRVAGTGSVWQASGQAITTGAGQANIVVESGGRINASSGMVLLPNSALSGNGVIQANILNAGDLSPGTVPASGIPTPGTLTLLGDYRQSGFPISGGFQLSGQTEFLVNGSGQASGLNVVGDARLAGRMLVKFDPAAGTPPVSAFAGNGLRVLDATSNLTESRFDLSVMPPLPRSPSGQIQFIRPRYSFSDPDGRSGFAIDLVLETVDGFDYGNPQALGAPAGPIDAVFADVGGPQFGAPDGFPDLLLLVKDQNGAGTVVIFTNQGLADPLDPESWLGFSTSPVQQYFVGNNPSAIAVGDLTGNGATDFVVTNASDGTMTIRRNDGFGGFAIGAQVVPVGLLPSDVIILELNEFGEDTRPEIVVALEGEDAVAVFRNLGGTGFGWDGVQLETILPTGPQPGRLAGFNIDNDKWNTFATVNVGNGSVSQFGNDGSAVTPLFTLPGADGPTAMLAGDFDLDGFTDIAIGSTSGITVLRNNGAGSFLPPSTIPTVWPVRSLAALDVDGDGDLDLSAVVTPDTVNELVVYRNDVTESILTFTPVDPPATTSEPFLIAAADVNQSGSDDIVSITAAGAQLGGATNIVAWLTLPSEGTPDCPGDANGDSEVNLADLNLVLANFGQTSPNGDVNGDGVVNLADLNLVLANFGLVCGAAN